MNIKSTIALGGIVLLTATGCVMRAAAPTEPVTVPVVTQSAEAAPTSAAPVAPATQEAAPVTPEAPAQPALSLSQENANRSGQQYIDLMGFSRAGLIQQLTFEGFTPEEAGIAADSVNVDWNAEAAESAQQYLDVMPMSRDELASQLAYEEFTPEQIHFGLTAVGY